MVKETSAERNARRMLPALRLIQVYVPLKAARWAEARGTAAVRPRDGITHTAISAGGVRCEWFVPAGSPENRVLLYLHGGGFIFGMSSRHRAMVSNLALKMGTRALMVDYRLAPANPFPAPLDDCVGAYRWLLQQGIPAQNLAIAGDSAGGNLTLATLMQLRDDGDPLPAAAACLSPVADLSRTGNDATGVSDPLLHPKAMQKYRSAYVAQQDSRNPLISPVFGDWRALPPLLLHAGEDEVLRADAVRVAELASAAGVAVRLEVFPRMWHVWQLYSSLPQAEQSLCDIAQFLNAHMQAAP